jgi:TolB-like protein/DNA-binding winged helix-turn-helix (wHTH) protein/Flp pilus assembly protein TadD
MPSLTNSLYQFGEFHADVQSRVLRRGEEPIALTPKAFDVLLLLIEHSGAVVTKDDLMHTIWPDSFVEESNLTQTVFMLRKALGETPDHRYILTVPGRGYRFTADVKQVSEHVRGAADALVRPSRTPPVQTRSRQTKSVALALGLVLIAGIFAYFRWFVSRSQPPAQPARMMLAVLPFQNLTGDAAQEYFSDGMTEEMITQLGNLDPQRLGIIARTSVMHYKNGQPALDQIGRELGVQYVLEGSVRRDSGNVRITAQLIQMKDQTHLWARQYDRELSNLLVVQCEIAHEIADEIQLTLTDHRPIVAPSQQPLSPNTYEAYDLYLKGRYYWNQRTIEGLQRAIWYFQQSIYKEPNYARSYAGLADSYTLLNSYTGAPQTKFIPKARAAALKALELDENLAEAHTSLALITENYDWDWQTAEKQYRRAIELNPNYATAHHWYAEYLTWMGRFDEAFRESEKARLLDPLSLIIAADNGAIHYFSRKYDLAIEQFKTVRERDPNFSRAGLIRWAYDQKGMLKDALADTETQRRIYGDQPWAWSSLAYIYGRSRQPVRARHALAKLQELNRRRPLDPAIIAWAYLGMGNKDQALSWLEKVYAQHSNLMVTLKVEPAFDPLRSDPRFQNLMRRVGFSE